MVKKKIILSYLVYYRKCKRKLNIIKIIKKFLYFKII